MALRDHSLDDKIIHAAKQEFLELGYQKASLHKIAEQAGTTTGALYTRYKNKDALFCSLLQNLFAEVQTKREPLQQIYEEVARTRSVSAFLSAIRKEEEFYIDLLFQKYEECLLFFCRSEGSSVERNLQKMMQKKTEETVAFLRSISENPLDFDGVELILYEQFHFYRAILEKGYSKEKAVSCMQMMDLFLEAGWKALFQKMIF